MERVTSNSIIDEVTKNFPQILNFVEKNGISNIHAIKQIRHGRNSQVYLIEQGIRKFIVKQYHHHYNDKRNRLYTEINFLKYLYKKKVNHVAESIAFDNKANLGIFTFLPGVIPDKIDESLVIKSSDFVRKINKYRDCKTAKNLPEASEACFSILSHIECVKKRVNLLNNIAFYGKLKNDVSDFVNSNMIIALDKIIKDIKNNYSNDEMKKNLPDKLRIISPSDFGFQNTLIDNNILYFLDFEYAGWDDPAKLICDFGCHPENPLDEELLQIFEHSFSSWLPEYTQTLKRSKILMPLYRLKWCCIMLNEFTSTGKSRRSHAGGVFNFKNQLKKSKDYFNKYLT